MLPEQSGGEGNSSSRLRFLIFEAGLDFPVTDFLLSNFVALSPADLSLVGICPLPECLLPFVFSSTVFAALDA